MTADCYRCLNRHICPDKYRHEQTEKPGPCEHFVTDPACFWESGWI